jgi:hypothetical protein
MPDVIVSADIDDVLRSSSDAQARARLGITAIGDALVTAESAEEAREAIGIPTQLHYLADKYVDTIGYMPSAIRRISTALQILDDNNLLEDLIDVAYFGTDGNKSTGTPISLRGVAAASFVDNFTRSIRGLTATQASTAGIGFDIPDTRTGTICVDCVSAGVNDLGAGGGVVAVVGNSSNANDSAQLVWNGTSRQELQWFIGGAYTGSTSLPLLSNISREFTRRSLEPQICIWTYGNADVKCWYQGVASHPTPNKNNPAAASVAQNRLSLFARNASSSTFTATGIPLKGTITSFMIFDRELTDAEAKIVSRAMRCLRSEPVTLVIEGDSNGREYTELTPTTHFPYKLRAFGNWDTDAWQTNCCTSGHAIAAVATYGFTDQWAFMRARDLVRRAIVMFSPIGVNDIGTGTTDAAAMWTAFKAILTQARNMGFETMVMTIPTIASPTWDDTQRGVATAFNALMADEPSAYDFIVDSVPILGSRTTNPTYWTDDAHPSGTGWALVAVEIYDVVGEP